MKAHPILFSGPMVRALLEGRKTQTRRIVKSPMRSREITFLPEWYQDEEAIKALGMTQDRNHPHNWGIVNYIEFDPLHLSLMHCPYGKAGDLLWVRESFCVHDDMKGIAYAADNDALPTGAFVKGFSKLKPSIHLPRRFSRLTLEITDVRVQRLHDISEQDALTEGLRDLGDGVAEIEDSYSTPRTLFHKLWENINGPKSWDENPWIWALSFKVHHQHVDILSEQKKEELIEDDPEAMHVKTWGMA